MSDLQARKHLEHLLTEAIILDSPFQKLLREALLAYDADLQTLANRASQDIADILNHGFDYALKRVAKEDLQAFQAFTATCLTHIIEHLKELNTYDPAQNKRKRC
jgi:hypothetical protein